MALEYVEFSDVAGVYWLIPDSRFSEASMSLSASKVVSAIVIAKCLLLQGLSAERAFFAFAGVASGVGFQRRVPI